MCTLPFQSTASAIYRGLQLKRNSQSERYSCIEACDRSCASIISLGKLARKFKIHIYRWTRNDLVTIRLLERQRQRISLFNKAPFECAKLAKRANMLKAARDRYDAWSAAQQKRILISRSKFLTRMQCACRYERRFREMFHDADPFILCTKIQVACKCKSSLSGAPKIPRNTKASTSRANMQVARRCKSSVEQVASKAVCNTELPTVQEHKIFEQKVINDGRQDTLYCRPQLRSLSTLFLCSKQSAQPCNRPDIVSDSTQPQTPQEAYLC